MNKFIRDIIPLLFLMLVYIILFLDQKNNPYNRILKLDLNKSKNTFSSNRNSSNNLKLHLPLNGSLDDISGNGYNGRFVGGNPNYVDYKGDKNGALDFDGTDDYVTNGSIVNSSMSSFFGRDAFTISLWVNPAVSPSTTPSAIISVGGKIALQWGHGQSQYFQSWLVQRGASGQSGGAVNNDGYGVAKYTNTFSLNTWYHITGTFDGIYLKAYLNGSLNTSTLLHGSGQLQAPVQNLYIGSTSSIYFQGSIADVRIYDKALTNIEVERLYKNSPNNNIVFKTKSREEKAEEERKLLEENEEEKRIKALGEIKISPTWLRFTRIT